MKSKKSKIAVAAAIIAVLALIGLIGGEPEENSAVTTTEESTIAITDDFDSGWINGGNDETEKITEEPTIEESETEKGNKPSGNLNVSSIPEFSGKAYVAINGNVPNFTKTQITDKAFETYSSLDSKGRCGAAFACLGRELMPTEDRGSIGQVKPSGWKTVKYDFVDGKYLYNRCHLIGFQLSGENANTKNLITGTRYMNVQGMLPFENMVADYIKETNNHVMYRVTPVFKGAELVARGVQIEAYSVEDDGDGICFNVYCYNNQPGVEIDYSNGESCLGKEQDAEPTTRRKQNNGVVLVTDEPEFENKPATTEKKNTAQSKNYILNTNSKKFHLPGCGSVKNMSDKNKQEYKGTREDLIDEGYSPCGNCHP